MQYNTIGIEYDHSVNYIAQLDEAVNFYENYKKNNPAQFIYLNGETYVGGLSSMDNDSDKAETAYSRYRGSPRQRPSYLWRRRLSDRLSWSDIVKFHIVSAHSLLSSW
mgnify:CR=1 FL=1